MKLRNENINAIIAFWAGSLAKANQNKARYPLIATFLITLKELLSSIDVETSTTLKICVGALRFTPDKSLFATIFNQARIKSGLSMSDFVYGASMLIESNSQINVRDGFYKPSYRFILTTQSLTPEDFLKYHENNQCLQSVAAIEKTPDVSVRPIVKKVITHKRQILSEDHSWNFKGSKYMRFGSSPCFFSSKPSDAESHAGSPSDKCDESSLTNLNLESLLDLQELAEINRVLAI